MGADVIAATLSILGLAFLASVFGYFLGHALRPLTRVTLLAAVMLLASLYASLLVGRLEMASIMPLGAAILATNLTPILILFSAGLAWTLPSLHPRGRHVRFVLIAALSILFFFAPLLRPWLRPVISDEATRFSQGVCLQSHSATCGAAAAATLLHCHGIDVSERTMIQDCLTSSEGTEPLGLYRGLLAQTKHRHLTANIAAKSERHWKTLGQFPLVALVTFRHDMEPGAGSLRRILGREAEGHAVVVFGQLASGEFLIGDPAVGRTVWEESAFRRRYCGQAIYLSKRQ